MLTFLGRSSRFCDGVTRRGFLRVGALGAISASELFALQARAGAKESARDEVQPKTAPQQSRRKTSVIFIELAGGPSHLETYDPKPRAPAEFRGPLDVVATNSPGVYFSQHLREQSRLLDKLAVVRSIHHPTDNHDVGSHLVQTGYLKRGQRDGVNEMPCFGAVAARVRGTNQPGLPAYVSVPRVMRNGGASYLGAAYSPFETVGDPGQKDFSVRNLTLSKGLNADRLENRRALLTALDTQRRMADVDGSSAAIDDFTRQALEMVTGPQARAAFDLSREKDRDRKKYGLTDIGQSLLLARRLVESGVTCVTVRYPGWDNHAGIADALEKLIPRYDKAVAALVRDLYSRGLDRDVLVVAMGEFGRTPRVNINAGRDHWGSLMSVVLAGGGLKPGIVGSSNAKGEVPATDPYRPENVLAMIYRHLGIDPNETFVDLSGRPRRILDETRLIEELI